MFYGNKMFLWAKFWGNISRDFGLRARKLPQKLGVNDGLPQTRLDYGKNISHVYVSYDTVLSLPTQFWPRWVFFPKYYMYTLSLNGKAPKSNFGVKLLNYKRSFIS